MPIDNQNQRVGDIQAAIEAGQKIAANAITNVDGIPVAILPGGMSVKSLDHLLHRPMRTKKIVHVSDALSFLAYFNRFSSDDSAVFCDVEMGRFIGIIDYDAPTEPKWSDHQVRFTAITTKEWDAWAASDGKGMNQLEFALFIEKNLPEIVNPPGAEMIEIACSLKARTKVNFGSAKRLDNGQTQIEYVEEIDGRAGHKGQLAIPETINLGVRVFEGGDAYEVEARFRYRVREGNLTLWYDLVRPHKVHRAALDDIFAQIEGGAECQLVIHGTP